jgi:protein NirF
VHPVEHGQYEGKDAAQQVANGKALYEKECRACHGPSGEGSRHKLYPVIAGQHYKYLLRQMTEIRDGQRRNANPDMVKIISKYNDDQLLAISAYQSSLVMPGKMCKAKAPQSGNAIGGAISQDGRIVVAQNYTPGGIKAFDAETLELLSEVPAEYAPGSFSKVVGLADLVGQRFAYALFDGGEIWVSDFSDPRQPQTQRYPAGLQPYDGLVTPDGRYYLAGLFGEDGVALLDTWRPEQGTRRILGNYGRGQEKLPVFKMPHLRGWSMAQGNAYLPAIGRHEVLVVAGGNWQEIAHIPVKGQPVFVMARPDGRQVWVNYAFPDNGWVEVIDTLSGKVVKTLAPGKAVLHMEFTPRGEQIWISARDDNRVLIYDTATFTKLGELDVQAPSGIFFTSRANRTGF